MSHGVNIGRIKAVCHALGELNERVVFVGGATVSLYADRQAEEARATEDVDVLVEIATRWDFAAFEKSLRQKGFVNDIGSTFIGRYIFNGLVVDVMPTDEAILGFSNQWYGEGFRTAVDYAVDEDRHVKIFSPPYFIASKLEAFRQRGGGDGRTSSDFEDIIFVLENRHAIWKEMSECDALLEEYLKQTFRAWKKNPYLQEWIDSSSNSFSPPASYIIMQDLEKFISR